MADVAPAEVPAEAPAADAAPLKACCACPDTKKERDECIMQKGEAECGHLIEAHKACMVALGFNI